MSEIKDKINQIPDNGIMEGWGIKISGKELKDLLEEVEQANDIFTFSKIMGQEGVDNLTKLLQDKAIFSQYEKETLWALIVDYHKIAKELHDLQQGIASSLYWLEQIKSEQDLTIGLSLLKKAMGEWESVVIPCPDCKPGCEVMHREWRPVTEKKEPEEEPSDGWIDSQRFHRVD